MGASFEHEIEPILVPLFNDARASAIGGAGPPAVDLLDRVDITSAGSNKSALDAPLVPRASANANANAGGVGGGSSTSSPLVQSGGAMQAGRGHSQSVVEQSAGARPVTALVSAQTPDVASAFGQRLDVVRQCTEYLFDNKTSEARKVCGYVGVYEHPHQMREIRNRTNPHSL